MVRPDFHRAFHLPPHDSRWVVRHGATIFGIHARKKRVGYDEDCVESLVCLFKCLKHAEDVARILRTHRSRVGFWPATDYDEGIPVECDRVGRKRRPLEVREVSKTVMNARLDSHGVKSVTVTDYLLDEDMLRMEIDSCDAQHVDDATLRRSLTMAFNMF